MGLMDFFRKGKEKPAENKRNEPAGNVPRPQSNTSSPSQPSTRDYTIQAGDSLSKIAKQFYGNASEWKRIYQANRDKIKDPDMIYPGQKIIIP